MFNLSLCTLLLSCLPLVTAQYGNGGGGSSSSATTSAESATTTSSPSGTYTVDVGEDGFVFDPDSLTVPPGGKVEFHFYPGNHSVVQAAFDNPCHPSSSTAFFSGFVPASSGESVCVNRSVQETIDSDLNSVHRLHPHCQRYNPPLVLLRPDRALQCRHGWSDQPSVRIEKRPLDT